MAHPKSRTSKMRKHKRRTHQQAAIPQISTCSTTGEKHIYHHAYYDGEGNMYYRGKLLVKSRFEE
jgi:large subunit ribosomal protein L32